MDINYWKENSLNKEMEENVYELTLNSLRAEIEGLKWELQDRFRLRRDFKQEIKELQKKVKQHESTIRHLTNRLAMSNRHPTNGLARLKRDK